MDSEWTRFHTFVGSWQGTGSGRPGTSQVERTYEFVLGDKFLWVRSTSTYPPQTQNPQGEVHEDWGLISRDSARKTFVLRQFHVEGFVNHYVLESIAPDGQTLVTPVVDGSVVEWDLRPTTWLRAACGLAGRDLTEAEWRQYLGDEPYRGTCSDDPPD